MADRTVTLRTERVGRRRGGKGRRSARLPPRVGCYLYCRRHILRAPAAVVNKDEIVDARVLDMHDAILRESLEGGGMST